MNETFIALTTRISDSEGSRYDRSEESSIDVIEENKQRKCTSQHPVSESMHIIYRN